MKKKGIFLGALSDWLGVTLAVTGIIFWAIIFSLIGQTIQVQITEQSAYLNNDALLTTYLRTAVNQNENLADLVVSARQGEREAELKRALNEILNSVYGIAKPVCWSLWRYDGEDKNLISKEECGDELVAIFDARTKIPLPDASPLDIRLTVMGYKNI